MVERNGWIEGGAPEIGKLVYGRFHRFCMNTLGNTVSVDAKNHTTAARIIRKRRKMFGQPLFVGGKRHLPIQFIQLMPWRLKRCLKTFKRLF